MYHPFPGQLLEDDGFETAPFESAAGSDEVIRYNRYPEKDDVSEADAMSRLRSAGQSPGDSILMRYVNYGPASQNSDSGWHSPLDTRHNGVDYSNLYRYAFDSPMNATDPSGERIECYYNGLSRIGGNTVIDVKAKVPAISEWIERTPAQMDQMKAKKAFGWVMQNSGKPGHSVTGILTNAALLTNPITFGFGVGMMAYDGLARPAEELKVKSSTVMIGIFVDPQIAQAGGIKGSLFSVDANGHFMTLFAKAIENAAAVQKETVVNQMASLINDQLAVLQK